MHFQCFIPDESSAADGLERVGLPQLLAGVASQKLTQGPNGQAGLLLSWRMNRGTCTLKYSPDEQVWLPAVANAEDKLDAGRYWVGIWKDSKPTPEDLERPRPFRGPRVTLGDGQSWMLPPVQELPHTMARTDDNAILYTPDFFLSRYRLAALEWRGAIEKLDDADSPLKPANVFGATGAIWPELRDFIEAGLQANYRIVPEVADHLKLWSTTKTGTVWRAVEQLMPEREVIDG